MDNNFIGREKEIELLEKITESPNAEFVAVYGRRRVGKTYLIQQYFDGQFAFAATGIIDGKKEEELFSFTASQLAAGYDGRPPENWLEAFEMLKATLEKHTTRKKCVIYIDELPCFDTPKSGFVRALGYFWNTWASLRKEVVLVVCGSATSWMIDNIIDNHGGLHDRITHSIYLRQFNLAETEQYLRSRLFNWPKLTVVETYMMFGGVPYYLSLLNPTESLAQNIDRLYFRKNAELAGEYQRLYSSLFKQPDIYIRIVEKLWQNKNGMTRQEITDKLKLTSSGTITKQLNNLVNCDIVRRYTTKANNKVKAKDSYYQLTDLFTLFHLTFSKKNYSEDYWEQRLNTPVLNTWQGLAFERVCATHIRQIRNALGLSRIAVEYYSWRSKGEPRAQIDMIIERADRLINLCEIKYAHTEYTIGAAEDKKLRNRTAAFVRETNTHYGILPTWITPFGLYKNKYSANVQYEVTLSDLFLP